MVYLLILVNSVIRNSGFLVVVQQQTFTSVVTALGYLTTCLYILNILLVTNTGNRICNMGRPKSFIGANLETRIIQIGDTGPQNQS